MLIPLALGRFLLRASSLLCNFSVRLTSIGSWNCRSPGDGLFMAVSTVVSTAKLSLLTAALAGVCLGQMPPIDSPQYAAKC